MLNTTQYSQFEIVPVNPFAPPKPIEKKSKKKSKYKENIEKARRIVPVTDCKKDRELYMDEEALWSEERYKALEIPNYRPLFKDLNKQYPPKSYSNGDFD